MALGLRIRLSKTNETKAAEHNEARAVRFPVAEYNELFRGLREAEMNLHVLPGRSNRLRYRILLRPGDSVGRVTD